MVSRSASTHRGAPACAPLFGGPALTQELTAEVDRLQTWSKRRNTVISDSAGAPGAGRVPHPAGSVTAGVPGPELTGEAVPATPGRAGAAQKPGGCRWGQGGAGPAAGPLSWRVGPQIQTLSFKKNKIPLLDPRNSLFKWSFRCFPPVSRRNVLSSPRPARPAASPSRAGSDFLPGS